VTRTRTSYGNVNYRTYGKEPAGLVALHGFTQHGGSFEELAGYLDVGVLAVDLPGHGATDVQPVTFEVAVGTVGSVAESLPPKPALLGYSQGGRIALALALARPELFDRLVLVSASAGIEDPTDAAHRRRADAEMANRIEELGVAGFLNEWLAKDLFSGLAARVPSRQAADLEARLENSITGLAAALRGMGQGAQPYIGGRLPELELPALFIAGGRDTRYRELAVHMASRTPDGRAEIVESAGHSVIGEQPERVAVLVNAFVG
jgi:2-succinyl-6-hydroxy-2,4-cyclohexadiene-1-carboxylate synthase